MTTTNDCRSQFEAQVKFSRLELNLDWDPAGFYANHDTDRCYVWFQMGYHQAQGRPDISLQDVLNGSERVYVDLAALERLSGPERAAMLKLSIAAEKPTGSASQPSAHFATYVQYAVSDELTKSSPEPRDVMRKRLWVAAQHDVFSNTGGIASMLDAGGLARVDYAQYQSIIDAGLQQLIDAGF